MSYSKYFKSGQKILLTVSTAVPGSDRTDSLTAYFLDSGPDYFDLTLPYGGGDNESFPFADDMPLVIHSEAFGLGLRLSGRFSGRQGRQGSQAIRVSVTEDLQVFQRRASPRIDIKAGLRYTKGRGTLRTFHDQWEKNLQILQNSKDFSKFGAFPHRPINLSSGGIRFDIKSPVDIADICLVLIDLGTPPPICALAEVVWTRPTESEERFAAGMRFLSLLDSDRDRLGMFVRDTRRILGGENR
ncbi:PilZ domain-containing protein [Trichloromonas sp.]|uniref:PilZ domain-containing protein n=1 Tax=Trichloromonas sp. TaxID=3069249 RepID=UPI003D8163DD